MEKQEDIYTGGTLAKSIKPILILAIVVGSYFLLYGRNKASSPEYPPLYYDSFQSRNSTQSWTPSRAESDIATDKITQLAVKGLISLTRPDIITYLGVEPLAWNGLSHAEKSTLVFTAMQSLKFQSSGKSVSKLTVVNVTTKEEVAEGDMQTGKVNVFK